MASGLVVEGWRRGPRSAVSYRLASHLRRLQPAAWASIPFPAKDDGSIALGFMLSLEGSRAGRFTGDSAPFALCREI